MSEPSHRIIYSKCLWGISSTVERSRSHRPACIREGGVMSVEAAKRIGEERRLTQTCALQIETHARVEFKDITSMIQKLIEESRIESGVCHVFVPHTTAALLKAALIGCSKNLLIENRRLVLGRWQGVFFCEFDGPRRRDLRVKIVAD